MMLIQSGSGADPLGTGHRVESQRRDDGSIPFSSIARRHRSHALLGVITLFRRRSFRPPWSSGCRRRSPALSFPFRSPGRAAISRSASPCDASGSCARQRRPRRPRSSTAPTAAAELALIGRDDDDALEAVATDPELRVLHESFLAEASRRRRGEVEVETAVAAAKLTDAQTLEDAGLAHPARTGRGSRRPGADRDAGAPAEGVGAAGCGLSGNLSTPYKCIYVGDSQANSKSSQI